MLKLIYLCDRDEMLERLMELDSRTALVEHLYPKILLLAGAISTPWGIRLDLVNALEAFEVETGEFNGSTRRNMPKLIVELVPEPQAQQEIIAAWNSIETTVCVTLPVSG